ncbi:hypothetical protein F4604DRAFT_1930908 [Suillus subluteus]|nr:hypothetical protein F4604DRAFT_1930908 [Suillus subluteus]
MKSSDAGLERPYYATFCSIVQSSGTGKSRLMTELQNKGVLVLMNLREPNDSGFPKRDLVPARILTEDMDCSQAEYTARCYAFIAAIFHTLKQDLSAKVSPLQSDSPGATIKFWNNWMCDTRSPAHTKFFEKVQTRYQIILDEIQTPKSQESIGANCDAPTVEETAAKLGSMSLTGKHSFLHVAADLAHAEHEQMQRSRLIKAPKLERASFVVAAYTDMLKTLHVFPQDDTPKLVIAFDEAHPLSSMSSKGFRPSHILGRTINVYCYKNDAPVWVVLASTTSQVADFSARQVIPIDGQLLYQPYTYLGWDQNADSLSGISANDVGKFRYIIEFGRPLLLPGVMTLAAQKLCKSKMFNPQDINEALAVLSQRFGLDICFGHPNAVSYLKKGVASHLRVCFSTTEDRSWAFTGYPSEPLLSFVAAIRHPEGQCGELASRLLLLLVKDMYVRSNLSTGTISDLHYNGKRGCGTDTLPESLSLISWGASLAMSSGRRRVKRLRQLFTSKLANVESSSARCDSKMIPIYFDDPALGFNDVDRVSQMFISDKAGKNSNERDLGFITRKHGSIQCLSELPCIALLLDLNVDPKLSVTFPKKRHRTPLLNI